MGGLLCCRRSHEWENRDLVKATRLGLESWINGLVKEGADVNACDDYGFTPLITALTNRKNDFAIAIIKAGADVNITIKFGPYEGYTPLMIAILYDSNECVTELIKLGADVNVTCKTGQPIGFTTVMIAIEHGSVESLKTSINAGADVNVICKIGDRRGYTAVMTAAELGFVDGLKALINAGADVNIINKYGTREVAYADRKIKVNGFTALILVATEPDMYSALFANVIEYLLRIECARLLLKSGALVNLLIGCGRDALRSHLEYSIFLRRHLDREFLALLLAAGEILDYSHAERTGVLLTILSFENTNKFVLAELCRTKIRKHLLQIDKHTNLIVRIPQLGLPTSLTEYLLYDISLDERTIHKPSPYHVHHTVPFPVT